MIESTSKFDQAFNDLLHSFELNSTDMLKRLIAFTKRNTNYASRMICILKSKIANVSFFP